MASPPETTDMTLRRSMSFPNPVFFGQESMAQSSASVQGEKKRGKLGYHRTSIACGKLDPAFRHYSSDRETFRPMPEEKDQVHILRGSCL